MSKSSNLPAPLVEAFENGTPMQQMLGRVLEEVGGMDFMVDFAEENPGEFMRMLMAANPPPVQSHKAGGGGIHIHVPPTLAPGPLDVVSEQ